MLVCYEELSWTAPRSKMHFPMKLCMMWPPFQTWEKVERTTALLPFLCSIEVFYFSDDVNSRGFGQKKVQHPDLRSNAWIWIICGIHFCSCIFRDNQCASIPSIFGSIYRSFTYLLEYKRPSISAHYLPAEFLAGDSIRTIICSL